MFNKLLKFLFGQRAFSHTIYEDKLWYVRWFVHFSGNKSAHLEWNFKSKFCGAYIEMESWGDDELKFHLAFPPFAVWFGLNGFVPKFILNKVKHRKIGWSIHDWTLWVSLWENPDKYPKFNINLDPRLLLFGDLQYNSKLLKEEIVDVPMPEKSYKMKVKLCEDTWIYKRIKICKHKIMRAHCDLIEPIPFPGKGTMSYNCGENALHGLTTQASSIEEAINKVIESVLDKRERYPL